MRHPLIVWPSRWQAARGEKKGNRALSSSVERAYAEIVALEYLCFQHNSAQIAVAVVVERGAWGAFTAPIARDIFEAYFNLNNGSNTSDKTNEDTAAFTR